MATTLRQLAELVEGQLHGDGELSISNASPLGEAQAGDITFLDDAKHAERLHASKASAAVVPSSVQANGMPLIHAADPLGAFVRIYRHFHGQRQAKPHGIDPRSCVHSSARIGKDSSIHALAVVGEGSTLGERCVVHSGAVVGRDCRLADDVILYPNCVLYDGTIIGHRSIIHANAVIGADGFGYRFSDGRHVKVPQLGHVEIGEDVEVGACTTIDRGTFGATRIGAGTKIDNLVQVAHNCRIGSHNLLISQMGIAGSSSTGDYVVIAGQAGIVDHVHIGSCCVIGAKAGVTKDVPDGQRMLGAPAAPEREQKRVLVSLEKLPEIRKDVRRIKQHLGLPDE